MVKRLALWGAGLVWIAAVATGVSILAAYSNTPGGVAHAAPASWPSATRLTRAPDQPVLVMMLHPKCPCSRATVSELARLMALAPAEKTTHVLFHAPAGAPPEWHRTDLWSDATAIPGVRVRVDKDGVEARRFGIATSGHVLLYDGSGRLRFTGGITGSRGHAGDNPGRSAVVALLLKQPPRVTTTSIFGCSLLEAPKDAGPSR
jgi:hypothetical protein